MLRQVSWLLLYYFYFQIICYETCLNYFNRKVLSFKIKLFNFQSNRSSSDCINVPPIVFSPVLSRPIRSMSPTMSMSPTFRTHHVSVFFHICDSFDCSFEHFIFDPDLYISNHFKLCSLLKEL